MTTTQRRDNFRRYWIRIVRDGRQEWSGASPIGIPNFILAAFGEKRKRCKGGIDLLGSDHRRKVLAERDTELIVCRFAGIRSEQQSGSRLFYHVADYSPIEQQPAIVVWGDWSKWLRENDTEGDILCPRIDATGE